MFTLSLVLSGLKILAVLAGWRAAGLLASQFWLVKLALHDTQTATFLHHTIPCHASFWTPVLLLGFFYYIGDHVKNITEYTYCRVPLNNDNKHPSNQQSISEELENTLHLKVLILSCIFWEWMPLLFTMLIKSPTEWACNRHLACRVVFSSCDCWEMPWTLCNYHATTVITQQTVIRPVCVQPLSRGWTFINDRGLQLGNAFPCAL